MWCKWLRRVCKVIFSLRAMTRRVVANGERPQDFYFLFRKREDR